MLLFILKEPVYKKRMAQVFEGKNKEKREKKRKK